MNIRESKAELAAPRKGDAEDHIVAIGMVTKSEFEPARATMSDLADCLDYDDWLDRREGLQMGLAMAGVEATIVPVNLTLLLEWSRLTGNLLDECALDSFAALALATRNASISKVLASVTDLEFAKFWLIGAFAEHGCYRGWLQHRYAMRARSEANGGRVAEFPVRVDDFIDWCACLGLAASETELDRYAHLMVEHLTG